MIGPRPLFSLGLIAVASILFSQDTPEPAKISVEVSQVVLYATVREGKARFVGDLQKENFTVLEDGIPQEIVSFSREDAPVAIGLLIDNSTSMMKKRDEVVAAAKAFVRASNPEDELFVLHFNEMLTYGLPNTVSFASDQDLLDQALETMNLNGMTALYDAIYEGLQHLENSKLNKKALIVISDGGDNVSAHKVDDVVREANLSGSLFYGIGIYDPLDGDASPRVLRRLAENTGGEAYFPADLQAVKGLCETIARDLRNQYAISYAPEQKTSANQYRRIQVKVKDPQKRKLIVRTRTGYYFGGFSTGSSKKQ